MERARTSKPSVRGRGAASNPVGRFERIALEPDPEIDPEELGRPQTLYLRDSSRSVISYNTSPDVGFDASLNPYRGCEHGCSYCYARPTHEYLGFSAGLDFETRIMVKEDAPELLRRELAAPRWKPQMLALSGVTDPYQPVERRLEVTRRCLEVLAEARNPVGIVTKNHLVTRDADLLAELSRFNASSVLVSVTTEDAELARRLEPRASHPRRRLEAIAAIAGAGVTAGVLVAPIIPGLNDHEIPSIVARAAEAGATCAGFVILRLPHGVEGLFVDWLERHFPERKEKVLARLRDLRGGKISESRFGLRMRGQGPFAEQIKDLFQLSCRKAGISRHWPTLSTEAFRRPVDRSPGTQMELFGDSSPASRPSRRRST